MEIETGSNNPQYIQQALKWLAEMGMESDPQFVNVLYGNIYNFDLAITDADLLMDSVQKRMLVWIEIGFWAKLFKGKRIVEDLYRNLDMLLPSYTFRVITDKNLFNLALKRQREILNLGPKTESEEPETEVKENEEIDNDMPESIPPIIVDGDEGSDEDKDK